MANVVLVMFVLMLIIVNVVFFVYLNKGRVGVLLFGVFLMVLAPVVFSLGSSVLLSFYDWSSGGTGEGAGYGAALMGIVVFLNGVVVLIGGVIRFFWLGGDGG